MSAKLKAEELVDKFTFRCKECDYDWTAKQCALIAVDEILEILWLTHKNADEYKYWQEVKKEIEKL